MTIPELLKDAPDHVLEEMIGRSNFVTVTKHTPVRGKLRRVMHEEAAVKTLSPALLRMDQLRLLAGKQPRHLAEFFDAFGGELVSVTPNLRTVAGITYVCDSLGNAPARPVVADWMALSENTAIPANTDTVLAGEITVNGLQRVEASYGHSGSNAFFTLAHTWTAAGIFAAVQKGALFTASSGGTMFLENVFTATQLQSGDQITVTWTINV